MNFESLETFVWVVRLESFTLAAQRFGMTQQSASARVAALERALGVPLVVHDVRHFKLTPQGAVAFKTAEVILRNVEEMKASLVAFKPK